MATTVLRSVPPGGTVTVRAADVLDDLLGHEAGSGRAALPG